MSLSDVPWRGGTAGLETCEKSDPVRHGVAECESAYIWFESACDLPQLAHLQSPPLALGKPALYISLKTEIIMLSNQIVAVKSETSFRSFGARVAPGLAPRGAALASSEGAGALAPKMGLPPSADAAAATAAAAAAPPMDSRRFLTLDLLFI